MATGVFMEIGGFVSVSACIMPAAVIISGTRQLFDRSTWNLPNEDLLGFIEIPTGTCHAEFRTTSVGCERCNLG